MSNQKINKLISILDNQDLDALALVQARTLDMQQGVISI